MIGVPFYDVFVSYRHEEPDRSWVRDRLVPRLDAAGLRVCVDYRSFRLGALLIRQIEEAVEGSRCTVAVLTERYLDGRFTELENVMAEHLGLERAERRLLVVLRDGLRAEHVQPRLSLRARLWLDMTDDAAFDEQVARLCDELRTDPDG